MYMFSKLYEFPPKLGSKTEDIFTFFFFPPVTDEETKHKEKFVFAHESRCDQPSQFFQDGGYFQDGELSSSCTGKVPGKLG